MLLSPSSWPVDASFATMATHTDPMSQNIYRSSHPTYHHRSSNSLMEGASAVGDGAREIPNCRSRQPDPASTSPFSVQDASDCHPDEDLLVNTFLQMLIPPILTPVEIGPKWASTRAFLGTMAAKSPVVKSAIMAFAAMQMQRSGMNNDVVKTDGRPLYDNAARQLSTSLAKTRVGEESDNANSGLRHILAALFLLIYTDLLTITLPRAHTNLREAYTLINNANKTAF
jgi:hypothetical protein